MKCPRCSFDNMGDAKFCNQCAYPLSPAPASESGRSEAPALGERRQVTVFFSDISGYTTLSERLDPEEVTHLKGEIFGGVTEIVAKYDGFIEQFIGDAVMVLFGVPRAHEDDPSRAIMAAREIHALVENISPRYEVRIGRPLAMHTGVNTGLVVTGEIGEGLGCYGFTGDAINVASRLAGLAQAGEIVVGLETWRQAQGLFLFERRQPATVKGKADPLTFFLVQGVRELSQQSQRPAGVRAPLVGRWAELAEIRKGVTTACSGRSSLLSVVGEAGSGKSRLVEEFKAGLNPKEAAWHEGHAFSYCQGVPYFPVLNLLSRDFGIVQGDQPPAIRAKVQAGVSALLGDVPAVMYLGSLFSLSYPKIEHVSPEYWKDRLHEAIQDLLTALAHRGSVVIYLEDLHWADPSTLELLEILVNGPERPILFLLAYRPTAADRIGSRPEAIRATEGRLGVEIRLQELTSAETREMTAALLQSNDLPPELVTFLAAKAEGNPFYLEEIINALMDAMTLVREGGRWTLTRPLDQANLPSTIQGVIAARLDQLAGETRRVLQEAAVIGRVFYFHVLNRITEHRRLAEQCLSDLEDLDLIRPKALEPDLEYIFKHALTQEVAYNGLLKKERQSIHERVGRVIEELFPDRLPEHYESLAFHFQRGQSWDKAVYYLVKAGEKSMNRYAVEEAHQYYLEAYQLLTARPEKTPAERAALLDVFNSWGLVYYYRGDFGGLAERWTAHLSEAELVSDKAKLGMFHAWLGLAQCFRLCLKDSYYLLQKAARLGEEAGDRKVAGYAYSWLILTVGFRGHLAACREYYERAREIALLYPTDHYLNFKSVAMWAMCQYFKGDAEACLQLSNLAVEYGRRHANVRGQSLGLHSLAFGHLIKGDFTAAVNAATRAYEVARDPFYALLPLLPLGIAYVLNNQAAEAEAVLEKSYPICLAAENFYGLLLSRFFLGLAMLAQGRLSQGLEMMKRAAMEIEKAEAPILSLFCESTLGKVYQTLATGAGPISLGLILKNVRFLLTTLPGAAQKSEAHFRRAIALAQEIEASGWLGQAYLELGLLYKAGKNKKQARECLNEAVHILTEIKLEYYLDQAHNALTELGS